MSVSTFTSMLSEFRGFYKLLNFSACVVPTLVKAISTRVKVKNLELWDMKNIETFDVIPSIESLYLREGNKLKIETLNLPAYPLLRSLKLYSCSSVKDTVQKEHSKLTSLYENTGYQFRAKISELSNLNQVLSDKQANLQALYDQLYDKNGSLSVIELKEEKFHLQQNHKMELNHAKTMDEFRATIVSERSPSIGRYLCKHDLFKLS
eukprot:gene14799-16441_t